jgi:hypothetical protein
MKPLSVLALCVTLSVGPAMAQCIAFEEELRQATSGDNDQFGSAVLLQGDWAYGGAPGAAGAGGRVVTFRRVALDWTEVGAIAAPVVQPGSRFGSSLARDSNWLAVGQMAWSGGAGPTGAVQLFQGTEGAWVPHQLLTSAAASTGAELGRSVAMHGSTLVAGAPFDGVGGAAYVYTWDGTAWIAPQRLAPLDLTPLCHFGRTCAVRNNTLVVGAFGCGSGAVYVFENVAGVWTQQARLEASDAVGNAAFGLSVALLNNTLVVGAPSFKPPGSNVTMGKAYVLTRVGGFWFEAAHLPATQQGFDTFGASVALVGDRCVVGAPGSRYAQVFERSGTLWSPLAKLTMPPLLNNAGFGTAVDIDGDSVLVGAPSFSGGNAGVWRTSGATATYCTAKTNSQGCVPSISISAAPSLTAGGPCIVSASNVLSQRAGLLFYSTTGGYTAPFLGGWLCVQPPIKRTAVLTSTGAGACDGTYSFDFTGFLQASSDPQLVGGARVWAQFWSRDPGFTPPNNIGLTDAVATFICP